MKQPIKLGSTVECVVSGIKGIAVSVTEVLNGNLRYVVQPRSDDPTKHPEAWEVDQQSLMVVDEGHSGLATKAPSFDIQVGDEVNDMPSGFAGTAISKTTHMNGCVYFSVVPKHREQAVLQDAPPASYLAAERLERTGPGLNKTVTSAPVKTSTGGPSTRAPRF